MILLNKNNQIYTLFNISTHFCECGTVQSGHLKSPARTKLNIYKIIFPKNKGTFIILMTVVIQYDNAYINLKNQDFRCGTFVQTKTTVGVVVAVLVIFLVLLLLLLFLLLMLLF